MTSLDQALAPLRQRIDAIDAQLLALLNERAGTVAEVFRLKQAHGAPRFSAARTEAILARLAATNAGPLTAAEVQRLFEPLLQFFANEFQNQG
ncbi:MAG: hypothetical protein EPO25_10045 [Gammaproteobacteria bacterium]|nr:MAG: hypothetical protein EPO25_10045 [Gammaproteobacteria bacterium]